MSAGPGIVLVGGARSHQENHAAAFAAAGCRLLAVGVGEGLAPDEAARHAELAATLDLPLLPLHAALALPDARIASVAVSMPHRARLAATCAAAGLALYLDKPLAGSLADAVAIAAAVRSAGVRAQIASHVTSGWARAARDALRDGRLGRLVALHADMLMAKGVPAPLPARARAETAAPTDFPEDIAKHELTDMGVYPVSLAAWLLGRQAETVDAVTANHFFAEHLGRDVEDYAAMLVGFEGGVTASLTCGRTGWWSWKRPFLARVVLVGERDTLVFDSEPAELLLTSGRDAAPPPRHPDDPMGMWLSTRQGPLPRPALSTIALGAEGPRDVADFVAELAGAPPAGIGVDAGVQHVAIIAAAYRSAAERRQVAIARPWSISPFR